MAEITRVVTQSIVRSYDFSSVETLIDVGGGNGALLAGIAAANSHLRGQVFDLPAGCADARLTFEAAGVADRCEVVRGDFFKEIPGGAQIYTLKNVIHDWNDKDSIAILRSCCRAAGEAGRLLIIERVMPELMTATPENQRKAMLDMNMLAMPGGQERTEAEFQNLLQQSGLVLTRIVPLRELDIAIIEARSAGG
jgi:hypothetical protein